jgi:hypothetical protein
MKKAIIKYNNITWAEEGIENWIISESNNDKNIINFIKENSYFEFFEDGSFKFNTPYQEEYKNLVCNGLMTVFERGKGEYDWDEETYLELGEIKTIY